MFLDQAQKIPDGPTEAFAWEPDLLVWIEANFRKYGDLYRNRVWKKCIRSKLT